MNYEFKNNIDPKEFDSFVKSFSSSTFMQTSSWALVKDAWEKEIYIIKYNGMPIAMTSPATLVSTTADYLDSFNGSIPLPWSDNGETFTDPLLVIDALDGYEITANFSYDGIGDYENDLEIYPNPANNLLTISNVNVQHVVIFNINGQVMLKQDFSNTVDVSALPKGMYFIKVSSADGLATKKFIKE